MNDILLIELSAKNIAGLIMAVLAIFVMFMAKYLAVFLTNKKFGSNSVVRKDEENLDGYKEKLAYQKKRYFDNAFLMIKLIALVIAIACALLVLL